LFRSDRSFVGAVSFRSFPRVTFVPVAVPLLFLLFGRSFVVDAYHLRRFAIRSSSGLNVGWFAGRYVLVLRCSLLSSTGVRYQLFVLVRLFVLLNSLIHVLLFIQLDLLRCSAFFIVDCSITFVLICSSHFRVRFSHLMG